MVMDYILNPLICTIICAKLTQNLIPAPYWVLAVVFASFFSAVNLAGVKTSVRLNEALTLGMMAGVVIFFAFCLRTSWGMAQYGNAFFTQPFFKSPTFSLRGSLRG